MYGVNPFTVKQRFSICSPGCRFAPTTQQRRFNPQFSQSCTTCYMASARENTIRGLYERSVCNQRRRGSSHRNLLAWASQSKNADAARNSAIGPGPRIVVSSISKLRVNTHTISVLHGFAIIGFRLGFLQCRAVRGDKRGPSLHCASFLLSCNQERERAESGKGNTRSLIATC